MFHLIWSKKIQQLWSYPTITKDMYIISFYPNTKIYEVSGRDINTTLKVTATTIGEAHLDFHHNGIGNHSIQSGATMILYLTKVPVYTIMPIGKCSSNIFLKYIRKQVEQFIHNVSCQMIEHQHFSHVPNFQLPSIPAQIFANKIIATTHKHGKVWVVQAQVYCRLFHIWCCGYNGKDANGRNMNKYGGVSSYRAWIWVKYNIYFQATPCLTFINF